MVSNGYFGGLFKKNGKEAVKKIISRRMELWD
jgi:hypothetical protein